MRNPASTCSGVIPAAPSVSNKWTLSQMAFDSQRAPFTTTRAEYFMSDPKVAHSPRLIRNPEVSIILPTYCRGNNGLLGRAIDSVLSQTFSSFELIVMDDGSTDGTAELVAGYTKVDDRIVHVRHDQNCGLPALRVNEGLMMARGDMCAYQFDDDQWTETFLATMSGALQREPGFEIAYGRCKFSFEGEETVLGGPFNYSQLVEGNFIANNSLIHRRSVFERLGGYDMHLVMRRLCDWDLWLRWGRDAAFLFVDEVVSYVEGGKAESIGRTIDSDSLTARAHMALDRRAALLPATLKSYVIDGLEHLKHLGERRLDEVWRRQVAPYQARLRHTRTAVRPSWIRPLHVVVVKAHFDTTIDITISNFKELIAADFLFTFVPQSQADETVIGCADVLLLHRTIDHHAQSLQQIAKKLRKPVIFLMDDDLTSLHELGGEFSYLAPGAPCRIALEEIIRAADLVITYSPPMRESIQILNPCNVLLETNIQRRWLATAKCKISEQTSESTERPLRIGFAGGGARRDELALLWPSIVAASVALGARAEFHFWGLRLDGLDQLQSPYFCEPFTYSYEQYLGRLTTGGFDVMIAPLFGEKRAKRAKCPIKFLEITAAGAIGVYSDVEPYRVVVDGVTGIKCQNTVESWTAAILRAAELSPVERNRLVDQAMQVIEENYTSEIQAPRVVATMEAAVLHGLLNGCASGKPRIAYFCHSPYLAGAENNLLRHAALAQAFQFEPLLVLPSHSAAMAEEIQRSATALGIAIVYLPLMVETEADGSRELDHSAIAEIRKWLQRNRIALVHSVTLMREVGKAAQGLGIPHVASLYATNSQGRATFDHCDVVHSDSFLYANRWGNVLGAPVRRIMSYVPDEYFRDESSPPAGELTIGIFGTLQPRKGQLQAVEAVGLLKSQTGQHVRLRLYGYDHFYPDYLAACENMAGRYGISDLVSFRGFVPDHKAALREVDVLLCASDWESIPLTILEAMAGCHLVVAPNVGGIGEILSPRTGILMPDNTAASIFNALAALLKLSTDEWKKKTSLAREVINEECSKYQVSAEIFRLYREAATRHPSKSERAPERHTQDAPLFTGNYEALELLRSQLHQINAGLIRTNGGH